MSVILKSICWYVALAVALGFASFIASRKGHPALAILVVVIPAALIVTGYVAEWEDNQPGGFNIPAPKSGPSPASKQKPNA
jgi:hypothetical protein